VDFECGGRGGFTRISVGQATMEQQLDDDWMVTQGLSTWLFPELSGPDVSGKSNEPH
jgi:hypothetical protein